MKCDEICERMTDVAAGFREFTADESSHLATCMGCAEELKALRSTMSLLDEWQVPEPSPYFDTRFEARLREEMAKPQAGWFRGWFGQPVLAGALTVLLGVGVGVMLTRGHSGRVTGANVMVEPPGSAVSDLQTLDKNHDMYADFELLDDLDVQQDVVANP
jgi:hypothetical protein